MNFIDKLPDNEECKSCILTFAYHELELLYDIALEFSRTFNVADATKNVMQRLKKENYIYRSALFIAQGDELELYTSIDLTPQQQKIATYKFGEGATGMAAQSGEPVVIENIHQSINYLNKIGSVNTSSISFVAVPIILGEKILGVITANTTKESSISFDELVRLLTIVGSISAQAFMTKKVIEDEKESLVELKTYYKSEMLKDHKFENIIGKSSKMQQIFEIIHTVAPADATVLVRGETGTGKELIAAAIHNQSKRKNGPFIKLNCAAINETLLESELFGHEKGAFTDAKEMRKGRFELADGGTLFLDEIGDITPSLQVKLLRILQEQEFERVGGTKTVQVNVRLVAATNRALEEMVQKGEFREDLFYRLNVIPINLPPLRERYEDVKLLVEHYLQLFMKEHRKDMQLSKPAMEQLLDYPWPGNIRELQNMMERIVLICPNGIIEADMLNHVLPFNYQKLNYPQLHKEQVHETIQEQHTQLETPNDVVTPQAVSETPATAPGKMTKSSLQEMEKEAILQALIDNHGIQTKAGKQLGMTARQIGYKIKKYGIEL